MTPPAAMDVWAMASARAMTTVVHRGDGGRFTVVHMEVHMEYSSLTFLVERRRITAVSAVMVVPASPRDHCQPTQTRTLNTAARARWATVSARKVAAALALAGAVSPETFAKRRTVCQGLASTNSTSTYMIQTCKHDDSQYTNFPPDYYIGL